MTHEEFDKQEWGIGMKCTYEEKPRDIISVDFMERLVGLEREAEIQWVRCENITLLNSTPKLT